MSGLVVVGASLAGLRAVEGARKSGYTGPITLIGGEVHLPYDRPPLSKDFLAIGAEAEAAPTFRTEQYLRDDLGVELILGREATGLDPKDRVIAVGERHVRYDSVVIATGARARSLPNVAGIKGVHTLRTLDDAVGIRSRLAALPRTVVLGAGFIGSEFASSAAKRGLRVTVVEVATTPLVRAVGEEIGTVLADLHRRNGTDLRLGVGVESVEGERELTAVRLTDGTRLEAELLVVGAGAIPATEWLTSSGMLLDDRDGGIVADEFLQTSLLDVYAAGDAVHWPNHVLGQTMRLEHWTSAAEQGAAAARNAVGDGAPTAYGTVPYFWSDWYGSRIQFVGSHGADETVIVTAMTGEGEFLALHRKGDRLAGALTVNRPAQIMKYRRMIGSSTSWKEALDFARHGETLGLRTANSRIA